MKWYPIIVLICISLVISDIEHLFMCLYVLAIYMSSLKKGLFRNSAHFFYWVFFCCCYYCWVVWNVCIFWKLSPCQSLHWHFLPVHRLSFILFMATGRKYQNNWEKMPKMWLTRASWVVLEVKNMPAKAGDIRDAGLIPGSGRSPGEGNGSPLQYSCLETSMDRGAWWATVHRVT